MSEDDHGEEKKDEQVPGAVAEGSEAKRSMNYPLVKYCDMQEEMRGEAMESVVTALEVVFYLFNQDHCQKCFARNFLHNMKALRR